MLRRLRREAILTGSMLAVVTALSFLGYFLFGNGGGSGSSSPTPDAAGEPYVFVWQRTENYRAEKDGIGLTVHNFRISPDQIRILYSLDRSPPSPAVSPATISLTDDLGQNYRVLSNAILGNALGVTAGLLITETYSGKGETLILTVTDMVTSGNDASEETVRGTWSVPFMKSIAPGALVGIEGMIAALPVTRVGDLTLGVAGPPGSRLPKLLIDRQGQQAALYGEVSGNVARPLTEAEFHTQLLARNKANAQLIPAEARVTTSQPLDDYLAPDGFPTPRSGP